MSHYTDAEDAAPECTPAQYTQVLAVLAVADQLRELVAAVREVRNELADIGQRVR